MQSAQATSMASETRTLNAFREDATAHLAYLAATGRVEVLTVDGEARGVVMSPRAFDGLIDRIEELEIAASVRRGMDDVAAGRTRPARQAILDLAAELGLDLDERQQ